MKPTSQRKPKRATTVDPVPPHRRDAEAGHRRSTHVKQRCHQAPANPKGENDRPQMPDRGSVPDKSEVSPPESEGPARVPASLLIANIARHMNNPSDLSTESGTASSSPPSPPPSNLPANRVLEDGFSESDTSGGTQSSATATTKKYRVIGGNVGSLEDHKDIIYKWHADLLLLQ